MPISPSQGSSAGGNTVTITGTNLPCGSRRWRRRAAAPCRSRW
ncbi:IPT/TIG domain-containing protein [Streptomyces niphimycinicus]|nr:IPT/TIG domain-containing protein [Streptomyces niphimycinicus]